jgi:hypothetical protein
LSKFFEGRQSELNMMSADPVCVPIGSQVCQKNKVQYVQFDSIPENVLSCARQLKLLGTTRVASLKSQ